MKKKWIGRILRFIGMIVIGIFLFGFIVMQLWNALIPELFSGPYITFWQSMGLLVLSHILLKGWGPWRHANGWKNDRWKYRFEERLESMTPEEREMFKKEWKERCESHC